MTARQFRKIALGMADAAEGAHMGHPDFRANGKIFATLYPDGDNGMVKLTPEQQAEFVGTHAAFTPASGAWGRQGCTRLLTPTRRPHPGGTYWTPARARRGKDDRDVIQDGRG